MPAPMPAGRVALHTAALVGYVCVAVVFTWPLPLQLSTALLAPPGGDTGVYVWNLWVFRHEIVAHSQFPFLTREILAPVGPVPLALHNYTAFANIAAFPLLPWLGTVATFNVLLIASGVSSAYAAFLLARARVGDAPAAWVAGVLFGFSPFASARALGHSSLLLAAPLPIFALLLYRIWRKPTAAGALLAGAVVAWAYLCDPYYAVYCVLLTLFAAIASVITIERRAAPARYPRSAILLDAALLCVAAVIAVILVRGGGRVDLLGLRVSMRGLYTPVMVFTALALVRVWMRVRPRIGWRSSSLPPLRLAVGAAAACLVLLSPVLYAMAASVGAGQGIGPKIYWRSSPPGIDLAAFAAPNPLHPLFGGFTRGWVSSLPNGFVENVASISWVAIGAIVAAVFWKRARLPRLWAAFTVTFALLALGPFVRVAGEMTYVPGPWALLRYVPVIGAARMPTRLTVLVMLGVAMLLAFALRSLRERAARPRLLVTAVGALLCFELLPAPRTLHPVRVPAVVDVIAQDPRAVNVLDLPFGLRDGLISRGSISGDAQFLQTFHEKPLVAGYVSRLPDEAVARLRELPVLEVLIRLSEGASVAPEAKAAALGTAADGRQRLRVGYVLVNRPRTSDELLEFAREAFGMEFVARDAEWELYSVGSQEKGGGKDPSPVSISPFSCDPAPQPLHRRLADRRAGRRLGRVD